MRRCSAAARQHIAETTCFAERGLHILPLPTGQGVFVKPARGSATSARER
ncbi:MAG: hypothetical protein AB1942_19445 [Pseudomonadota bacterium]